MFDFFAVGEAVAVGVAVGWIGAVAVDFVPIGKAVAVGVFPKGVGPVLVDFVPIGKAVAVAVFPKGVGPVFVDLVPIGEAIAVAVRLKRIGPQVDFRAIGKPIVISVRVQWVGAMGGYLVTVPQAVAVGVGPDGISMVIIYLGAIGQAVAVGVAVVRVGATGRFGLVGKPVAVAVHRGLLKGKGGDQGERQQANGNQGCQAAQERCPLGERISELHDCNQLSPGQPGEVLPVNGRQDALGYLLGGPLLGSSLRLLQYFTGNV